jgi:hypothetical protein
VGESDDFALLRAFGQTGAGLFPLTMVLGKTFHTLYGFNRIGEAAGVTGQFYAVSVERKLKNAAVIAIGETARERMVGSTKRSLALIRDTLSDMLASSGGGFSKRSRGLYDKRGTRDLPHNFFRSVSNEPAADASSSSRADNQ